MTVMVRESARGAVGAQTLEDPCANDDDDGDSCTGEADMDDDNCEGCKGSAKRTKMMMRVARAWTTTTKRTRRITRAGDDDEHKMDRKDGEE